MERTHCRVKHAFGKHYTATNEPRKIRQRDAGQRAHHIKVKLNLDSSLVARDLLFRCHDWVRANNATLEVESL